MRSAAKVGPGGWVRTSIYCRVLEAVGIVREMNIWEARATRGSVCMRASGIWKWRVTKKVSLACMVWCAFGALFEQEGHSLC